MKARALGARGGGPALFAAERPPKLVLRFAVVLSLALALASALILIVVHHFALSQAERAATRHAGLVASTVLQREVTQRDLGRPVPPSRRHELDALLRTYGLTKDVEALSLVRRDGLVTYSTDHEAIGKTISGALAAEAAAGTIVSRVSAAGASGATTASRALETYAPVGPDTPGGAALIAQSYEPIARSARSLQLRVGAVLEGLLIVLFALLVPLLIRVTRRIQRQITLIHQQAFYDELTGLPNRTHLFERLGLAISRATEEELQLAVFLVDLNRFREINDTLGHAAGDVVLVEAARRMQVVAGDERLLARLGGDDFVFAAEFGTVAEAMDFAEQVLPQSSLGSMRRVYSLRSTRPSGSPFIPPTAGTPTRSSSMPRWRRIRRRSGEAVYSDTARLSIRTIRSSSSSRLPCARLQTTARFDSTTSRRLI